MKIAVIGAGSWGSAIAQLLAINGHEVNLWALEKKIVEGINNQHKNPVYLNSVELDKKIVATNSFEDAFDYADMCVMVTPSQFLRATAEKFKDYVAENLPVVICSKGAEHDTGMLASEVLTDVLGN